MRARPASCTALLTTFWEGRYSKRCGKVRSIICSSCRLEGWAVDLRTHWASPCGSMPTGFRGYGRWELRCLRLIHASAELRAHIKACIVRPWIRSSSASLVHEACDSSVADCNCSSNYARCVYWHYLSILRHTRIRSFKWFYFYCHPFTSRQLAFGQSPSHLNLCSIRWTKT